MSRAVLIVDGYNVIRQPGGPYARLFERDPDAARTRLVSDVAGYAYGEWIATIVFDAGGNPHADGAPERVAGIDVVFSAHGSSADSVVERLASEARASGRRVTVVSSDAQTQWSVMGSGVQRMSARDFIDEVLGEDELRSESNPSGSTKSTLSERLDSATLDELTRWSRGHHR